MHRTTILSIALGILLYVFLRTAFATNERVTPTPVAPPVILGTSSTSASSAASASAAASSSGGATNITTRSLGLGAATAANPSTCWSPILFGLAQAEDARCAAVQDALMLRVLGEHDAARERLCQDDRLRRATVAAGGACKE